MSDAIRALHPEWLQPVGGPTHYTAAATSPVVPVFIEGQRRGYGLDRLADLVTDDVKSVRHISASEAIATYGPEWSWGAIVVTMAR